MGELDYGFYLGFLQLGVGSLLLLMGRRLFWLFVSGLGFFAGFQLATVLLLSQPDWMKIVLGVFAGALGVVIMIFMQKVAIVYAGFFAGGYLLNSLWFMLGIPIRLPILLLYCIGGVLGAVMSYLLFDQALIILTSLVGAVFIIESVDVLPSWQMLLFVLLTGVGIIIQSRQDAAEETHKGKS